MGNAGGNEQTTRAKAPTARQLHALLDEHREAFTAHEQARLAIKRGRRAIPLSQGLAQALWLLRGAAQDDAPVFPSGSGGYLDDSNLRARVLKPAAKRAGVPWAGFHTLRHTCATMLFRHGLNAKQVQMWLGHHSPAFTLATHVHLLPEDLPDAGFLDDLARPRMRTRTVLLRTAEGLALTSSPTRRRTTCARSLA